MANLTDETEDWPEGVYQIETVDPVVGGTPNPLTGAGMSNIPHLQLAMRTRWLKAAVDSLITAVASVIPSTRQILAGGLATGGGDLSADRTITVPKATEAEAIAGIIDTKALTPMTGMALAASIGVGVGQDLEDVLGSRAAGTIYTNGTGKPIFLILTINQGSSESWTFSAGPDVAGLVVITGSSQAGTVCLSTMIPAGWRYRYNATSGSPDISHWVEMR